MKKTILLTIMAVAVLIGCKGGSSGDSRTDQKDTVATSAAAEPKAKPIDTLALFDFINGRFMDLSDEKLWSKDIFTPDYYEACQKLNEFSDGDALWELGSIQELRSISLTDLAEFKIVDPTHIIAEAALDCKDIDGVMEGTEFRTLSLILRDGNWLIDDVGGSKQDKKQAVAEHEAEQK